MEVYCVFESVPHEEDRLMEIYENEAVAEDAATQWRLGGFVCYVTEWEVKG